MLSEEEKEYWFQRYLDVVTDKDEKQFILDTETLPPEKEEELSNLLVQIWSTEPLN